MRRTWIIPVVLLGTCGTCLLIPAFRHGYRQGVERSRSAPKRAVAPTQAQRPDMRTGIAPGELVAICERRVRARLKAPDTAEFPGLLSGFEPPEVRGDSETVWRSWVTAKNPLGVALRLRFVCRHRPQGDEIVLDLLD